MVSKLQIVQLRLKNYRQFKDACFDFIDHETGEALDRVCFIGANGTGKTTILELLSKFLNNKGDNINQINDSLVCLKLRNEEGENFFVLEVVLESGLYRSYLSEKVEKILHWRNLFDADDTEFKGRFEYFWKIHTQFAIPKKDVIKQLEDNSFNLAIYASPDGSSFLPRNSRLPLTTLDKALKLTKVFPTYHQFSHSDVSSFWEVLIYQIKQRERHYIDFLNSEDIRQLSVAEAETKFNNEYPEILVEIAKLWNIILEPAGLEFDIENAKIPVQLNENLEAYIRLKNSKEIVPYNQLSTGIRNFMFRLGHIFSLYFNREIERGFLLVDEPELSLFPDLLFDIVAWYESIIHNTQFFVATHSPMVAAQFKASERFILEFDDSGYVQVRQGISPEGDDPNDLLMSDFSVRSLYGKVGQEQWQRVLELRKEIKQTEDIDLKTELLDEYMGIINAYNFAPHELS